MNWKLKLVAAAMAVASAAPASAALAPASSGDGSLFLTVWNSTVSYTRDLGTTLSGFLSSVAGTTTTFAGDALFASTFGTNPTGFNWNIVAGDQTLLAGSEPTRLLTTGAYGLTLTASSPSVTRSGVVSAGGSISNFTNALNSSFGCNTAASCTAAAGSGVGYGGDASWANNIGNSVPGTLSNTSTAFGDAGKLGFYFFNSQATSSLTQANRSTFNIDPSTRGYWTLASNGDAVWTGVSAVPVPAAVWLLGSGLMGMVGIGRRKQNAAVKRNVAV